jgi:acetyl esterase/lipase
VADNPLVHLPRAWPVVGKVNALRRQVVGRVRSFDLVQWDQVEYGQDVAQRVHIWELNDLAPRDGWPCVLLIHGGGWRQGSWRDFESMAPMLTRRGFMVAALDYRLAPEHPWPAALEDVYAALEFLRGQWVDPEKIALWGHSAGGQLAMMAALERPGEICCTVALGAPTDLQAQARTEPLDDVFTEAQLHAASPLHHPCEAAAPILQVHGTSDRICDIDQARRHAAERSGVSLIEVTDGDHGLRWPLVGALRARRQAVQWMVDQMDMPERGSKWRARKKKNR